MALFFHCPSLVYVTNTLTTFWAGKWPSAGASFEVAQCSPEINRWTGSNGTLAVFPLKTKTSFCSLLTKSKFDQWIRSQTECLATIQFFVLTWRGASTAHHECLRRSRNASLVHDRPVEFPDSPSILDVELAAFVLQIKAFNFVCNVVFLHEPRRHGRLFRPFLAWSSLFGSEAPQSAPPPAPTPTETFLGPTATSRELKNWREKS